MIDKVCKHCGLKQPVLEFVISWLCADCEGRNDENADEIAENDFRRDFQRAIAARSMAERQRIKDSARKPYKRFGKRSR